MCSVKGLISRENRPSTSLPWPCLALKTKTGGWDEPHNWSHLSRWEAKFAGTAWTEALRRFRKVTLYDMSECLSFII